MTAKTPLAKRLEAITTVIGDWLMWVAFGGFCIVVMVAFDKPEQATVVLAVWLAAMMLIVIPLLVIGTAKCWLRLRTAWRTGADSP